MSKFIIPLILTGFVFAGCKKGPDDPSISLISRKSRIEGQWRLKEGKITLDIFNQTKGTHFDGVYTIDGSTMHGTETTLTTIAQVSGAYLLAMVVDKKGRFNFTETFLASNLVAEGSWDFNNGVGDEKSKESVIMQIDHVTEGITGSHYFNQTGLTFKYKIKELRSKTLVLNSSATVYANTSGETRKIAAEYTFVQ